jgi:hypothetical protein
VIKIKMSKIPLELLHMAKIMNDIIFIKIEVRAGRVAQVVKSLASLRP